MNQNEFAIKGLEICSQNLGIALNSLYAAISEPEHPELTVLLRLARDRLSGGVQHRKDNAKKYMSILSTIRVNKRALVRAASRAGFEPTVYGCEHHEAFQLCKELLDSLSVAIDKERIKKFNALVTESRLPKDNKDNRDAYQKTFTRTAHGPTLAGLGFRDSALESNTRKLQGWLKKQADKLERLAKLRVRIERELCLVEPSELTPITFEDNGEAAALKTLLDRALKAWVTAWKKDKSLSRECWLAGAGKEYASISALELEKHGNSSRAKKSRKTKRKGNGKADSS